MQIRASAKGDGWDVGLAKRLHKADIRNGSTHAQYRYRLAVAIVLGSIIFFIDTFTDLGSAVAVLYVLVIVLAGDLGSKSLVRFTAATCACLTVGSFLYSHGLATHSQSFLRLLFSLAANGVTTLLLLRRGADRLILEAQAGLLELTSDAIFLRDGAGRVIYWNNGAETLYGRTSGEVLGRKADEFFDVSFPVSRLDAEQTLAATGQWEGELKVKTGDGRTIHVFSRWRMQQAQSGSELTVLETSVDISERKATEAALQASEHRYRTIFETLAVAIWEHDFRDVKRELEALRAGGIKDIRRYIAEHPEFVVRTRRMVRITDVNQTALKLLDVPTKEEFFSHLDGFLPENDASFGQCLIAIDEGHSVFQAETTVRSRQGRLIPVIVMLSFPPDGEGLDRIQASIVDITERLQFQEALENSRRELEAASRAAMIGEISASIAHEVNQPLSAIMTSVQAAQRWLTRTPPDMAETTLALDDAILATEHAADVVKRVRMLLGKAKSDTGEVAIDALITDTVRLKQNELSSNGIQTSLNLRAVTAIIRGDRILLQQAFANIIANAIQAMETTDPSRRTLVIESEINDGNLVLKFMDTGAGLDHQIEERLFKAFSTTKPNGMGLGLAMCRSIVNAHNGSISIRNRQGAQGAIVEIELPVAVSSEKAAADGPEMA